MSRLLYIVLVFVTSLMFFSSCCFRCDDSCVKHYNFENHYTLTPAKDSISIGDTIWIKCDFSTTFKNSDGEMVDFSNIDLLTEIFLAKIDTSPYIQNYQDFDVFKSEGELSFFSLTGVAGHKLIHNKNSDSFRISFGLIPKATGLYNITITSGYNVNNEFGPELKTIDECDEYVDYFDIYINNGIDTNYEFLENAKDIGWQNLTKDDFDRNGGYCFYVVD